MKFASRLRYQSIASGIPFKDETTMGLGSQPQQHEAVLMYLQSIMSH